MSKIYSHFAITSVLLSLLAIFGCSSSGGGGDTGTTLPIYSGSTTPAAITSTNAEEMSRRSTEGVNELVDITTTGEGIPLAVNISSNNNAALVLKVEDIAREILNGLSTLNLPAGLVITWEELNAESGTNEFCGGSVTVPDDFDPDGLLNLTMTFNNLCFDDGITALVMNGTITFTETASTITVSFTNFSVNIDGTTETITATITCDISGLTCTISTDFIGSDGNVYRITNATVTGDAFSGYDVNATFYHYELGVVTITTTVPITYGGCGIFPDYGMIDISSSDGSFVTATFNINCTFEIKGFDGTSSFGPTIIAW